MRGTRTHVIRRVALRHVARSTLVLAVVAVPASCSKSGAGPTASGRSDGRSETTTVGSTATSPLARDGDGWAVPESLPAGSAGDLLAVERPSTSPNLGGGVRTNLLYRSSDRSGRDVAVSGILVVPPGTAPDGGWPIVSWAHGTSGVADRCAPSTTPNLFYNEYAQMVRGFVGAGYAVVASDYIGLGTPGLHSYSVGDDLGNAVVDVVAAARRVEPSLSSTWYAVGHSEGGQAALFATRAATRQPDLRLAATVAIAPSSHLELALPAIAAGGLPADVVYGLYLIAGLSTVDTSIDPVSQFGPAGREQAELVVESGCLLDGLVALRGVDASTIFSIDETTMARFSALLGSVGNIEPSEVVGPLLVVQGADDHDIPAAITGLLVDDLRAARVDVEYREYPALDHDTVLGPSLCETLDWMADHGGPRPETCVPEPTDLS